MKSFPKYKSLLFSGFCKNIYYVIFIDLCFSENVDFICTKYTGSYTCIYNCVLSVKIKVKKVAYLLVVVKKNRAIKEIFYVALSVNMRFLFFYLFIKRIISPIQRTIEVPPIIMDQSLM